MACSGWLGIVGTGSAALTKPQYPKSFPRRYPNLALNLVLFVMEL
jgi:hypothetical protein